MIRSPQEYRAYEFVLTFLAGSRISDSSNLVIWVVFEMGGKWPYIYIYIYIYVSKEDESE